MYYFDFDGNGCVDMYFIEGIWINQVYIWFNLSCGFCDVEGDDVEGVVDLKFFVQFGNVIGSLGFGEFGSEDDCENFDDNDWCKVICMNFYIKSYIDYEVLECWNGFGVLDVWLVVQFYINCCYGSGKCDDKYSNIVSLIFLRVVNFIFVLQMIVCF